MRQLKPFQLLFGTSAVESSLGPQQHPDDSETNTTQMTMDLLVACKKSSRFVHILLLTWIAGLLYISLMVRRKCFLGMVI